MKAASLLTLVTLTSAVPSVHAGLLFSFDYTFDTGGFFSDPARKSVLEAAAADVSSRIEDSLTAIPAAIGPNTWTAQFLHPATGSLTSLVDLTVPDSTMVIYVGARDLAGDTLGQATTAFSGSGTGGWVSTIVTRGQVGATTDPATSTDFGPWGGSIAFDTAADWYFDPDTATAGDLPALQYDFYSVAVHELGHLLGLGTAASWTHLVTGTSFTGTDATAANGGSNPTVLADGSHWASGATSSNPVTGDPQEAALDPDLVNGARKALTELDWAAFEDIGWQVTPVPEPVEVAVATGVALGLFAGWRRRQNR